MHEKAMMDDMIRQVLATAEAEGSTRVVRVRARLGVLSHFTPDHFKEHFDDAARGTIAEGALVESEIVGGPTDPEAQTAVIEEIELQVDDE